MNIARLNNYSLPVLRYGLTLVFLYFAINQLIDPSLWTGYLPDFLYNTANPEMFVYANAVFEIIFGILLALGVWTRIAALLLALHLFGIAFASLGISPVGVRDFGLAVATLAIFLYGPDDLCLQKEKNI